jgi:hydroxymethylpyrimidine pyrophosphatase-like HAD family hydrolase
LFSLNNVELWGKRETTTFKAVITYNGTFITSNEIVFKNKSNAALADLINEFNQRFKLQLIRPIHNAVHETVESGSVFGTKHIADDNVSEFFVFDERGNALENEEGIPYYQVPYYAVLLMKDPEKEDATYEIL